MNRFIDAMTIYEDGLERVKKSAISYGQKFFPGEFVNIVKNLPSHMSHFESNIPAKIEYTYAHAYSGDNVTSYSLLIRSDIYKEWKSCSWYHENQLNKIEDKNLIKKFIKEIDLGRID